MSRQATRLATIERRLARQGIANDGGVRMLDLYLAADDDVLPSKRAAAQRRLDASPLYAELLAEAEAWKAAGGDLSGALGLPPAPDSRMVKAAEPAADAHVHAGNPHAPTQGQPANTHPAPTGAPAQPAAALVPGEAPMKRARFDVGDDPVPALDLLVPRSRRLWD
jgi:hypothetical protein